MKTRLVALVGLAIGLAVPVLAQEENTVDPQVRQQVEAAQAKYDEAFNKNDAAAIAALFTQDAAEAGPEGIVVGQEALQKRYVSLFQNWYPTDHVNKVQEMYVIGNDLCAIVRWSVGGYKGDIVTFNVRDGDTWKVRVAYFNVSK
jgi:uncharacterized protein (TIGR02246 family)